MTDKLLSPSVKKERVKFWLGIIGLLVLLGLGGLFLYAVWRLIEAFIHLLRQLDPKVATQIIATSGTILAAVLAVVIGQLIQKRREIIQAHRNAKIELYNAFIQKITDVVLSHDKKSEKEMEKELIKFFQKFNTQLILSGSSKVIRAYHNWREVTQEGTDKSILAMDVLLKALRNDLGHSNSLLGKGGLIKLYLKPGEFDKLEDNSKNSS